MRTAGIICEYNPFHRGHLLQLEKTRETIGTDGAIVCLMSGFYVQRGEPALFPPAVRAEAAVRSGADLVLELPITAAVNAAGYFAEKAVWCLDQTGCIDVLSFGSECGEVEPLDALAEALGRPQFQQELKISLESGCSFAAARTRALIAMGLDGELLELPNNALGVEYLRAIRQVGGTMVPFTFQRDRSIPSAGELRSLLTAKRISNDCGIHYNSKRIDAEQLNNAVPDAMRSIPVSALYKKEMMHTMECGEKAMRAVLRSLPDAAFERMAFESEGIYSKVRKACRRECSVENIIMACKSRRFAYSRLRRTLMCLFLGLSEQDMQRELPYLRVLAFNDRGRQVLSMARKKSRIPMVAGAVPRDEQSLAYFQLEQRAADLYTLFGVPGSEERFHMLKSARPIYVEADQGAG